MALANLQDQRYVIRYIFIIVTNLCFQNIGRGIYNDLGFNTRGFSPGNIAPLEPWLHGYTGKGLYYTFHQLIGNVGAFEPHDAFFGTPEA